MAAGRGRWPVFWLCVAVWNTAWGGAWLLADGFDPIFALVLACGLIGLPLTICDVRRMAL